MAGIYIHIPFCKQRCTYCDFYTRVAPELTELYIGTLIKEIELRRNYINGNIKTIYFGGGTPSILKKSELDLIFDSILNTFNVDVDTEITLEANPDDLTDSFIQEIITLPINRLSIGIQSFNDSDLQLMHRRHTAREAIEAVKRAQNFGFGNISIDLIYGLPGQTLRQWNKQLTMAFGLGVQHISAYGLTYEKETQLYNMKNRGEIIACSDVTMNKMYSSMVKKMRENGFEAYEISNFAKPGFRSKHNSAYWKREYYLGLGPSAHSYNGVTRQWNVSSTKSWINAIKNNLPFFDKEVLSEFDNYNEYIMVSLRTAEGVNLEYIKENFDGKWASDFLKNIQGLIKTGHVYENGFYYALTEKGFKISDFIISKLMLV